MSLDGLSGISDAVSAAYDVMVADDVDPERAASLAVAAERDGRDPVAWAEYFVRLRRAIREADLSWLDAGRRDA